MSIRILFFWQFSTSTQSLCSSLFHIHILCFLWSCGPQNMMQIYAYVTSRTFLNPAPPTSAMSLTASAWRHTRRKDKDRIPAWQLEGWLSPNSRTGSLKRPQLPIQKSVPRPAICPCQECPVHMGKSATGMFRGVDTSVALINSAHFWDRLQN